MAIVISGVNNNDKITASDGTIDLLSGVNYVGVLTAPSISASGNITAGHLNIGSGIQLGNAGVVTATTFIGNLTGNVTGNVNATSNLLLQIGGSEKFRVGSSGQFGIGGANYGTSGQVLTSGGSGSAATWSTIPTPDADKITEGNTEAEVIDTGSDGHFKVTTEGSERLRIKNDGKVNITPGGALSGNHPPGDLNIVGTNFLTMTPNDNANASDNEVLGHIAFLPYAAGTIAAASAKIEAVAESGQSGSANPTSLRFYTKPSGSGPGSAPTERVRITQSGQVCIGTNTATRPLNIKDPAQIYLESTNTGNWSGIQIKGSSGTNNYNAYFGLLDSNGNFFIDNGSNGNDFIIKPTGQIEMPNQPMVRYAGGWSYTSWNSHAQVVWGGENEDIGGNFSNGVFTVPTGGEGVYVISAQFIGPNPGGNYFLWQFYKNTTGLNEWVQGYSGNGNAEASSATIAVTCSVGDTLRVAFHTSYQYAYTSGYSTFSIFKVH